MFKNPLKETKTSAPLRGSDRRKLRQRVQEHLILDSPEEGDLLVPEGLQSRKITTHSGEPGVVYTSPEGDPLWFSIGKKSDELIPTVYTLWKRPTIIPVLSTPSVVIPVLMNGADLMAAGVVEVIGTPKEGTIVSVSEYVQGALGPPLAVGRINFDGENLVRENVDKGKAVAILHTWKDHLWNMGSTSGPPEPSLSKQKSSNAVSSSVNGTHSNEHQVANGSPPADNNVGTTPLDASFPLKNEDAAELDEKACELDRETLTAEEISTVLREALLQTIKTSTSSLPPSAFPMPASAFYTGHLLPARPVHVASASPPADVKHSTFKSLSAFLKQAEKQGLLRLKDTKSDTMIVSINASHDDVKLHVVHKTVGELEIKQKEQREKENKREREQEAKEKQVNVTELWQPHQTTIKLFQEAQLDTSALYSLQDLKAALNAYITTHDLVNKAEQQFINANMDPILRDALWPQTGKSPPSAPEFVKRDKLLSTLCSRMQPWYRIQPGSGDPITKKGHPKPISVVVKTRQGRKACTFITGHESFHLLSNHIADALRLRCASATSVTPLPGRAAGEEVMVQGKQIKAIVGYLQEMGIQERWIQAKGATGKKK